MSILETIEFHGFRLRYAHPGLWWYETGTFRRPLYVVGGPEEDDDGHGWRFRDGTYLDVTEGVYHLSNPSMIFRRRETTVPEYKV